MKLRKKTRVTETEFLKHLEKVCKGDYAKSQILGYYEEMKLFDKKNGKQLSPESFGKAPKSTNGFYDYCDQAKNLFLPVWKQKLDELLHQKFLLNSKNKSPEQIQVLCKKRKSQQTKLFENRLENIGYSELFRYQFVNFINSIDLQTNTNNQFEGAVNMVKGILRATYNENVEKGSVEDLSATMLWRHELTHLMSIKSANNSEYRYLTPLNLEFENGESLFVSSNILKNSTNPTPQNPVNPKVRHLFNKGNLLINEIATELSVEKLIGTRKLKSLRESSREKVYKWSPDKLDVISIKLDDGRNLTNITSYFEIGHLAELVFNFSNEKQPFVLSPSAMPTFRSYEVMESFVSNGKLSKPVQNAINQRLAELTDTKPEVLRTQDMNWDKFLILLGNGYETLLSGERVLEDGFYYPQQSYNQDIVLLQAMLVDMEYNYVKDMFTQSKTFESKQQLYKTLRTILGKTENVSPWILKPNTKLSVCPDHINARHSLSQKALSATQPENLAMKAWAKHISFLARLTNTYAPHLLEEFDFLKKEIPQKLNQNNQNLLLNK